MRKPVFIVNPEASYLDCIDKLEQILSGLNHATMNACLALETQGEVPVLPDAMLTMSDVAEQGKLLLDHITDMSKPYHGYGITMADAQAHAKKTQKKNSKEQENAIH